MRNKVWKFDDVAKVLSDKRSDKDIAKEIGRTETAVKTLHTLAGWYQNGRAHDVSTVMRAHFQKFFAAQGTVRTEEQTNHQDAVVAPTQEAASSEICEHQMDALIQQAETQFQELQQTMAELARWQAKHATHGLADELRILRQFKQEAEPKLEEFNKLQEKVQKSGFGTMLRGIRPF